MAQRFPGDIRFASDSKVSDIRAVRGGTSLLSGALKVVIVNRVLCIACAGDRKHAFEALTRLPVEGEDLRAERG